jgi:hypothetical protein
VAYFEIAQMSADIDLSSRVAACAAQEGKGGTNPRQWAADNMLVIAAAPGWADSWAYAIATGNQFPGKDPAVITDGQILAAVQPLP